MKLILGGTSDIGNYRKVNQDSLLLKENMIGSRICCIGSICDGVGGLQQGEYASTYAILSEKNGLTV